VPTAWSGEFKKPVYDSKFTKLENEMSFVNSNPCAFLGLGEQGFESSMTAKAGEGSK
jgi:hypothetical protein